MKYPIGMAVLFGMSGIFLTAAAADWWKIDTTANKVETPKFWYQFGVGNYDDNGRMDAKAIETFKAVGNDWDYCMGIEGCGTGYALYDHSVPTLSDIQGNTTVVSFKVHTDDMDNTHRITKDLSILEIENTRRACLWVEDAARAPGTDGDVLMIMYGMPDIDRGKYDSYRSQAEANCGENFGDCWIQAAGSTVAKCTYKGHFIYGVINKTSGLGMGFVYPTKFGTHDWKVWNLVSVEFFYAGPGKRWIYLVTKGKDEILSLGKAIADAGGFPAAAAAQIAHNARAMHPAAAAGCMVADIMGRLIAGRAVLGHGIYITENSDGALAAAVFAARQTR